MLVEFNKKLNSVKPLIQLLSHRYSSATNIPVEEFISALHEEFFLKFNSFDESKGDFRKYAKVVLTQRAIRVATRKEWRFYSNLFYADGQVDEENNPTFEFEDTKVDVQTTAIDNIEKNSDKWQLIRALTERADDFTMAVVNRILENPDASNNSIARELGVDHKKVDRCLRRLARNYDPSRFGDITQYLAI
jgi:hypothetical protein